VRKHIAALVAAAAVTAAGLWAAAAPLPRAAPAIVQSDLDDFMQKVVARRDENWKKLQQYVLDERELFEVRGSGQVPVWGERREYTWYLRDGFFVRSPVKVNGVAVQEDERRKFEENYLRRVKERDRRRGRGGPSQPPDPTPPAGDPTSPAIEPTPPAIEPTPAAGEPPKDVQSLIQQTRQPEFIDSAYFLRFKVEQGKYALVGRETFDGRAVLRVEYYPARLFSHEQEVQQRRQQKGDADQRDFQATVERLMNKVALVTIWVEPTSYQIVKYTFDNVNLDFLPAAWLLHVEKAKASMTMSQPLPEVWLPRDVDMLISATMAIGSFDAHYHLDYHDYRKAETSSKIKSPDGR
jgi:hypothetical protein